MLRPDVNADGIPDGDKRGRLLRQLVCLNLPPLGVHNGEDGPVDGGHPAGPGDGVTFDLGYLMQFWLEPGERDEFSEVAGNVTTNPGFPTRRELVERYALRSGRDVTDLTAYVVLAIWKLAILLEASYSRHLAGTTDDPFFALLDKGVPALLARARSVAHA